MQSVGEQEAEMSFHAIRLFCDPTVVSQVDKALRSREKEGAYTLHNSMDGTGEHYCKGNKPGGERQIPYALTYKWNLINKTNKQAKYNQRH